MRPGPLPELPLRAIVVGERHRQDLGDLSALTASIAERGLLHPIVVRPDGQLVAGARRLAAVRGLGWETVRVTIVEHLADVEQALLAERDENTCRKDFTPSEAVRMARALEPFERAAAKVRQREAGRQHGRGRAKGGVKKAQPIEATKTRARLAQAAGFSPATLSKAAAVVDAAQKNPERFGSLRATMDRTGNISGAFRQLEKHRLADQIAAEPPPLPTGPFRVIIADPPWPYALRSDDVTYRGRCPYPSMSIEAICALPVRALAAEDCILWLWTTNVHMRESYQILDAWGFTSKTILTWAKQRIGLGDWLRGQTEHCHLAYRGRPTVLHTSQSTLLEADAGAHSAKPDAFYTLVHGLCPGSTVELFQRTARPGIVGHGTSEWAS